MDRNLVTVIFCLLIAGSMNTFAQRHYKNISALEMNYGSNIFGDYGHYGNLSFSKYVNRKSYWKAGISYFEKPYDYAIPKQTVPVTPPATPPAAAPTRNAPAAPETPVPVETEWADKKAWDLHLDGSYYYTIVTNLKSATKSFIVLFTCTRSLITELLDKLRLKYPLLPTIPPYPTMRLETIRSIIPISCSRHPKSVWNTSA